MNGRTPKRPAQAALSALVALGLAWAGPPPVAAAQEAEPGPTSVSRPDAMRSLEWLVGEWEGEGWIRRGPEEPMEFLQTERVEAAFGGRLLLVEGVGRARMPDGSAGAVGHHAFGVLSWSPEAGSYRFDTYLADEPGVDAEARLEDGVLTWGFEVPGGHVRYRIRRTEDDEWHEEGEYSPDGATWYPFLEMRLRRAGS